MIYLLLNLERAEVITLKLNLKTLPSISSILLLFMSEMFYFYFAEMKSHILLLYVIKNLDFLGKFQSIIEF